jgi:hypothetical protein
MTKLKTNKTFIKQKPRIKIKIIKNEIKIQKAKRMIEKKKKQLPVTSHSLIFVTRHT